MKRLLLLSPFLTIAVIAVATPLRTNRAFIESYCVECHDKDTAKGDLDLAALTFSPENPANYARWVLVHDRVKNGEMPPRKRARPEAAELEVFINVLASDLVSADRARIAKEGRATRRRLNRYEYENALRDLLHAPWLRVRDFLPEDGEADRFNKNGGALEVSHVQMARYIHTADYALRTVLATQVERPDSEIRRYYARDQVSYGGRITNSIGDPSRNPFPVIGFEGQPEVRRGKLPITVGSSNAALRELEGAGVVASAYESYEPKFDQFTANVNGWYKLRFHAYSVWVGPSDGDKWRIPNLDDISRGRRDEPVSISAVTSANFLRDLGNFDVTPEPGVYELETWLFVGESVRADAGRLFRPRPGPNHWENPLAQKDGQPAVVLRWLEVEGPMFDVWPTAGHKLLFGDLSMVNRSTSEIGGHSGSTNRYGRRHFETPGSVEVVSYSPKEDAERLIRRFIRQAYRCPSSEVDVNRFLPVVFTAMEEGSTFTDAMIAGYTAVLCSPKFLFLEERPGELDGHALASRLAFFLWNSPPDAELLRYAELNVLHERGVLRAQTERLLADPKSERFVNAFLDYWLELRKITATAPDANLYSDYYLDDLLTQSALEETRMFFTELLIEDLPTSNIVASDFAMLNERLAAHYGLAPVHGVKLRKTRLPKDSVRGGFMTQASVLKVTANGTTTSPVLRGAWIMERILGQKPQPPPPNLPAVEPDLRGAVTIRQQLEKHRSSSSCNACHAKIDPAGFALENFDVMGGWRDRYRSEAIGELAQGIAKNGQKYAFHYALPVDASGELPDGRKFHDARELKKLLLADQRQLARSLVKQLSVYATGAPISFADREQVEKILDGARSSDYGVRSLVLELVQSDLFLQK